MASNLPAVDVRFQISGVVFKGLSKMAREAGGMSPNLYALRLFLAAYSAKHGPTGDEELDGAVAALSAPPAPNADGDEALRREIRILAGKLQDAAGERAGHLKQIMDLQSEIVTLTARAPNADLQQYETAAEKSRERIAELEAQIEKFNAVLNEAKKTEETLIACAKDDDARAVELQRQILDLNRDGQASISLLDTKDEAIGRLTKDKKDLLDQISLHMVENVRMREKLQKSAPDLRRIITEQEAKIIELERQPALVVNFDALKDDDAKVLALRAELDQMTTVCEDLRASNDEYEKRVKKLNADLNDALEAALSPTPGPHTHAYDPPLVVRGGCLQIDVLQPEGALMAANFINALNILNRREEK